MVWNRPWTAKWNENWSTSFAAKASGYNPASLSGLTLWLDAQDNSTITASSNNVSQWDDKSGLGNNVTATDKPTYSATSCNSRPGLTGNGSSNYMITAGNLMADGSNYTMTVVGSGANFTGNSVMAAFGAHMAMQLENNTSTPTRVYQNNNPGANLSQHLVANQTYIFTLVYHGINKWIDFYINGVICGQEFDNGQFVYLQGQFQLFAFGAPSVNVFGACTAGEVAVYNRALSPIELAQNHTYFSNRWGIAINSYTNYQFDIFVCNGQSNMPGRNGPVDYIGADLTNPLIFQLGRYDVDNYAIMQGFDTLNYVDTNFYTVVGLAMSFAKKYVTNSLAAGRAVLLLPCAFGGSGFSNNDWNPGDSIYEDMVTRTQTVLARYPGSVFKGWLWHQGEADAENNWTALQYNTAFDAMMSNFQGRVTGASSAPIVVGQLLIGGTGNTDIIQGALANIPSRWPLASWTTSVGLSDGGDNLHFTAASERILGARYFGGMACPGSPFLRLDAAQSLVNSTQNIGMTSSFVALTPTVTGTSGGTTLLCSGDASTQIDTGAKQLIRVNGTDVYTVASQATSVGITTITISGTLSTNYTASSLAVLRISQFNDLSGSSNSITQSTSANKPYYMPLAINSLPSLKFNAAESINMAGTTAAAQKLTRTTAHTIVVVFKANTTSSSNGGVILNAAQGGAGSDLLAISIKSNALIVGYYNGSTYTAVSTPFSDTSGYHILTISHSVNGTPICMLDNAAMAGNASPFAGTMDGLSIGTDLSGNNFTYDGYLAEIEAWNSQLTSAVILTYTKQLASKYNITIS